MKTFVLALLLLAASGSASAEICDYYASPNGAGNGASASTPFRISDFLEVARPGSTLCLLDGTYQGEANMLSPATVSPGLSGSSGNPITVRALNDGGVTIDGQYKQSPCRFKDNSWWVVEGINCKSAGGSHKTVLSLKASSHNVFRRVVAWDAAIDSNAMVIGLVLDSVNNLFEDVAGFGTGRKVFSHHSGSNNVVCRRCWFRWEGSIAGGGPGVTLSYLTTGALFENVLVTWSGESMPESYTVPVLPHSTPLPRDDFQFYGGTSIMGIDRLQSCQTPKPGNLRMLGSIVYTKATDRLPTEPYVIREISGGMPGNRFGRFTLFGQSYISLRDVVSVMAPSHPLFDRLYGFGLGRNPHNGPNRGGSPPCSSLVADPHSADAYPVVHNVLDRSTSIRGTASTTSNYTTFATGDAIHPDWTVTGFSAGTSLSEVQSPWQNTSTTGARVCYRTENGVTTTTPLWPWPMNDRIMAATEAAGPYRGPCPTCVGGRAARSATDVTRDIEALLGRIPEHCKR
jgi:hypothetical protein